MKTVTIPEDFRIDVDYGSPTMHWTDETRKFHVWLKQDGTLSEGRNRNVIHANLKAVSPYAKNFGHSTRDPNSKTWKPLIDAMLAKIKDEDLLTKAKAAKEAADKAFEEEQERKYHARLRKNFEDVMHVLPLHVYSAVRCMSEEETMAFIKAYEEARHLNDCVARYDAYQRNPESTPAP